MPTTIYDSSLITKRRQVKAESGNFINRIQNPVQPNTGYAPALGIWDQSIINDVNNGQMKYYRKGTGGLTTVDNGCPCLPATTVSISSEVPGPISEVPGPVRDIVLTYGSVIVTWNAPNSGGTPTSYTVSAIPISSDLPTITITDVLTPPYSFATVGSSGLIPGTEYQISVIGVNAFGDGLPPSSTLPSISAPYGAPFISVSQNSQVDQLVIGVNYNTRPAFTLTSGTTFIIKMYINGALQSTPSYTSSITPPYDATITVSGLTQTQYSFTVQIVNANDHSSISSLSDPVAPYSFTVSGVSQSANELSFYPFSDPITITYVTSGGIFGQGISSATIYIPIGSQQYENYSGSATSTSAVISVSNRGTFQGCYIIIFDNTGAQTPPSELFEITVQ